MNAPQRVFDIRAGVRESVPILLGNIGCSGSGKTWSAMRLANGIQSVTGGDIHVIDTESRRALHYADNFKFKYLQFDAPFGSLDYLSAMEQCVKEGAKVIVVDSMSHEHVGPGGYLLTQEAELERIAGSDLAKRERAKFTAWIKPAKLRQQMINGMLHLGNVNLIFNFRAKEKTKPLRRNGKVEVVEMGFMPIAGEELLFEMTVNCLLMPKSGGVPTWRSDQIGERLMMKCPKQFEHIFATSKPLDEDIGRQLAEWAKGGAPKDAPAAAAPEEDFGDDPTARLAAIDDTLVAAADRGMDALKEAWAAVPRDCREPLKSALDRRHKPRAVEADRGRANGGTHAQQNGNSVSADAQSNMGELPDHPQAGRMGKGEEEPEGQPETAANPASPAPEEAQALTAVVDPVAVHTALAVARERGAADFRNGVPRKACPPEYRDKPEGAAWVDGWAKARAEAGVR